MNTTLPTPQPSNKRPAFRKQLLVAGIVSLVLLAIAGISVVYRQQIVDQFVVWNFRPTASLMAAASRAGLNDTGTFYLYASQAEIVDSTAFNDACGSLQSEQSVVIGCYTRPSRRIYVYNVTDTRLDGVIEATSAHEMLHAAYDRLSNAEKKKLSGLLTAERAAITDSRLLELIARYETSEPTELMNELHSILPTEVRSLSPELEAYYGRYFSNRLAVVTLTEQYEQIFTDLEHEQETLVQELEALATNINAKQDAYDTALERLNTDIATFNVWARSGNASSYEYDTRRGVIERRITVLETERHAINTAITTYNSTKAKLDALNSTAQELNQSINSNVSPIPSI